MALTIVVLVAVLLFQGRKTKKNEDSKSIDNFELIRALRRAK